MADLADRHIEEHAKVKNKPRGVKRALQLWNRSILPKLGKHKVADIQRADVAKVMTEISKTPALANRVLSLLFAQRRGFPLPRLQAVVIWLLQIW